MRRGRLLRRLAVLGVVLLGVLIAADVVALQVAESKAAAGFAQSTAAERVTVDMGGFPFLPGLLGGRMRRIELKSRGLSGGGLRVESLELRVADVRFEPSKAVALIRSQHANRAKITASNPYGRLEVTQPDLEQFVRAKEPTVHDVRITPSGIEVRFAFEPRPTRGAPTPAPSPSPVVTPPVRFLPRIQDRRLILTVVGFGGLAPAEQREVTERARAIERSIDLPPLPEGLSPPSVNLGNGSFVVEASGSQIAVLVGEGGIRSA